MTNDYGITVCVTDQDYNYDQDSVSWEELAKYLSPHMLKEQHRNDDAE